MVFICGRTRNSPFPPKAKQQKSLSNRGLCQSYFNSWSSSSTSFSDFCLPLPWPAALQSCLSVACWNKWLHDWFHCNLSSRLTQSLGHTWLNPWINHGLDQRAQKWKCECMSVSLCACVSEYERGWSCVYVYLCLEVQESVPEGLWACMRVCVLIWCVFGSYVVLVNVCMHGFCTFVVV